MIDLHTHTLFSDGELVPSELVRRAEVMGLTAIGLTDHGDSSNIDWIIPRVVAVAEELNRVMGITVVPGIEITHVPPVLIPEIARRARSLGAKIIVVHGETISEPVAPGTNASALVSDIDILAHPGLITREEALLAREKGILLEITARKGHSLTNGHVAALARETGAGLLINTDTHAPSDLINEKTARKIVCGAGLTEEDFSTMQKNAWQLVQAKMETPKH
ncbi:MAG: histidinol phosphate phosphatase domain-containing protein [Proteobacteria bacterium]|nr:histidinol phosphate phosphatase domain-containing protein [Desulfobacteraceae bacterium]MBU4002155.1 histidinol phosphate phosphatase domain-containing protein [Pseudomonadota bacterium]MBU4054316.1 histidinol phosphate phosphatase domain-containing protein [Pseudomonadota bacterium]MBU4318881.1 histidinol phosphate phosphatase domain-containing protein [Pseudomonadota bacterium]MBU4469561.1 histidinol phosphate phosphatase domain-containing protein [Pseudomonadota bacterium]